jgi:LuxR family transcriptional regulator
MAEVLEHLKRIVAATSVEEVWDSHIRQMASYGFDRALYGFTRFRTGNLEGDFGDTLVLSNHPPSYVKAFFSQKLYLASPMLVWSQHNVGAQSWGWIAKALEDGTLPPEARKVHALNASYGITAGYTISFQPTASRRSLAVIGLAAREGLTQRDADEIWGRHGTDIELQNAVMNLKVAALPQNQRRKLTDRQREVLEWVADGKTTQDIAVLVGLTKATVEKHLRLAREVLDVETTAQAVLKASIQNQIFLFEGPDSLPTT